MTTFCSVQKNPKAHPPSACSANEKRRGAELLLTKFSGGHVDYPWEKEKIFNASKKKKKLYKEKFLGHLPWRLTSSVFAVLILSN